MVSDKRKEIIIDSNMTIAELSFLFLENKYERIAVKSYGTYQDRLGIINEYLGSIKLKDFRKERIKDFENYLTHLHLVYSLHLFKKRKKLELYF